jgi:ethanolaminephosphotransferase
LIADLLKLKMLSVAGADRIHLLLQNARQVKKIVQATYPSLGFGDEVQDMDCEGSLPQGNHLACRWQKVVQVMSTVASVHPQVRVDFLYNVSQQNNHDIIL